MIDFTKTMWGHNIHASTYREQPKRKKKYLWSKPDTASRRSFMVHTSDKVFIGEKVQWKAADGIITGVIYDFHQCSDPRDMYTLYVELLDE